ncbi:MAX gene-associated protein [Bombina bombina]|uniref:MAX gene-associated protein n=1 Tax=Bombina bombina TaxID=8345 RepID=UPI00235B0335|nr:MAX gene-associated protein [Bombina bombina]
MEKVDTLSSGQEGSKSNNVPVPGATPAYFVILQQSKGNGNTEEGIVVANRDVSSVAAVVSPASDKSTFKAFLSAECTSGQITVTLDNNNMWNEFYRCTTEMILTKQGRRMFPYCRYSLSGLCPFQKYILVMDITPMDNNRYKWNGQSWEPGGVSEPHVLGRVFIHPESPSTGQFWMHQPVSFYKLKLTNNVLDQEGHIILHSMHRYLPRLHIIPTSKTTEVIQLNGPDVHTFTFPQTEFIAVTAYQNVQITQLKIDCNPFARGFREGGVTGKLLKDIKSKNLNQGGVSPDSKAQLEDEDSECTQKMKEQFRASDHSDAETEAFIAENDFVNFLNPLPEHCTTEPKENHKSSVDITAEASPLNGQINNEIKDEPWDNYDYDKRVSAEGVEIKPEESEEELTDEYSNSDDEYPILEKQLRRQSAQFQTESNRIRKRSHISPSGVAKAKLLKLDSGKLPVVYLEPCSVPKSTIKISDLRKIIVSQENYRGLAQCPSPAPPVNPHESSDQNVTSGVGKKDTEKVNTQTSSKNSVECLNDKMGGSQTSSLKRKKNLPLPAKPKGNQTPGVKNQLIPGVRNRRGRPRKVHAKFSSERTTPLEPSVPLPDINPDLVDVEGVLFVAFASKEALAVHTGVNPDNTFMSSCPALPGPNEDKDNVGKFPALESQLLMHLETARHRQVIHPALQQVGLKLNIVDPTMSIDLRYLGVQLPLPYITNTTRWDNYGLCSQASGLPYVSRTGKTNDYTKIKGWRDKFSTSSVTPLLNEGSSSETSLKNRSAFCSDKLDEYLENEAKLMQNCEGISQNENDSSVVYQLPTKSTSYVKTLDSVLKKQVSLPQSSKSENLTSKPLSASSTKKQLNPVGKAKTQKAKSKLKSTLPSPVTVKEKSLACGTPEKSVKTMSEANHIEGVVANSITSQDESFSQNTYQAQLQSSQPSSPRHSGFSKAFLKLLDMENCIVWDGKPRTYITEERADIALATILTAQASLKNKPVHKIIPHRRGVCSNAFCRLGCICSSLAHERLKSTHCRRVDCMFGCTCLKHKVILVKGGVQIKKISHDIAENSEEEENLSSALEDKDAAEGGYDSVPKSPVAYFPIWKKSEDDSDSEPICIPMPVKLNEDNSQLQQKEVCQPNKTKYPGTTKSARVYTPKPNPVILPEDMDPVYLYFDSMMTCARVRVYTRKPPEVQLNENEECTCDSSDLCSKEHCSKSPKNREKRKEVQEDMYDPSCSPKRFRNCGPAKLIEIISDCNWEQDRIKILNIISKNMSRKEPQYFRVGAFNIDLMSETKSLDQSGTPYSSRVKISMDDEQCVSWKHSPGHDFSLKWKVEIITLPEGKLADASPESKLVEKSHGGKGLPFYTKIIPAGNLVARLKKPNINHSELIQVNGKYYPHAKLLLGQMGALHPANRLAAYITHRLRPSLYNQSGSLNPIVPSKITPTPLCTSDVNSKDANVPVVTQEVKTSPQKEIAPPPSSVFTKFVMSEVGTLHPKNPGINLVITSVASSKQNSVFCTTSAKIASLSSPSLTATVSPSNEKEIASVPTLIKVTNIVTKDSSVSLPAETVATNTTNALTVTSVTPTKDSSALPFSTQVTPMINQPPQSTVTPSTLPLPVCPAVTVKNVSTPIVTNVITPITPIGSSSLTGINPLPSLTLKPEAVVPQPSVQITRAPLMGTEKRLGPRLLLIPVQSNPATVRPIQNVQQTPGQKMVLQPIKSPGRTNLFRHPNGQIIQLVPLQQVCTPSNQPIVFRNPGSVVGIRLPLPTKAETTPTQTANFVSPSVSPAIIPASTVAITPSTASTSSPSIASTSSPSITSPSLTISSPPPFLSQAGTLRLRITAPTNRSESSQSSAKVITVNSAGQIMDSGDGMSLQPGSFSLLNSQSQNAVPEANPVPHSSIGNIKSDIKTTKNTVNENEMSQSNQESLIHPVIGEIKEIDKNSETLQSHEDCFDNSANSLTTKEPDDINEFQSAKEKMSSDCYSESTETSQEPSGQADYNMKPKETDSEQLKENVESKLQTSGEGESVCVPKPSETLVQTGMEMQNAGNRDDTSFVDQNATNSNPQSPDSVPSSVVIFNTENRDIKVNKSRKLSNHRTKKSKDEKNLEVIDCTVSESSSDANLEIENSDFDESVDIETVEELSEKINIARLKATAGNTTAKCNVHTEFSKESKKSLKKSNFKRDVDEDASAYYRRTHTANERRRRNEMRDLFEELKNSLGLHNLPKVSKSYILKQAIEEIEGLTDQGDTLIKKKALLTQKRNNLIRKVSALSGKTKEVVVKKLEYIYAKQKALEAEKRKKHFEEDIALHKASMMAKLPQTFEEPLESFTKEKADLPMTSGKPKKPLILSRKKNTVPLEAPTPQPVVSLSASNLEMTAQGSLVTVENPIISEQVEGVTPTVLKTEINPEARNVQQELTSVLIQIPITLSVVPDSASAKPESPTPEAEKDDLSMMPKIVNVTSLANEASIDLGTDLSLNIEELKEIVKPGPQLSPTKPVLGETEQDQGATDSTSSSSYATSSLAPSLVLLDSRDVSETTPENVGTTLVESPLLEDLNSLKKHTTAETEEVKLKETAFCNVATNNVKHSQLDVRLKTLPLEEPELDTSDLIDVIGDNEDTDETLTSLLNELAFLNQQLNTDDLDNSSDFPGSDTASRGSGSKFNDGDASPFSFGRFKEKSSSLSPLFLHFEEGEVQETSKQNEEAGIVEFVGNTQDEPSSSSNKVTSSFHESNVNATSHQKVAKQENPPSGSLWRPMPKLAPLGLKTLTADQRAQERKAMPSLAPVALRLNSQTSASPSDEQTTQGLRTTVLAPQADK